jgi:hypothetical protein
VQEHRVRPGQLGVGAGRDHVLPGTVQTVLEGPAHPVPATEHVLIAAAAEQPGEVHTHPFAHGGAHRGIVVGDRPAAVPEVLARVLVGTSRTLQHTIEADVVHDDDPHP